MESGGTGSIYRLVVDFARREAVGDRPFRSRKRAVGRVSTIVRSHAGVGEIIAVRLERADVRVSGGNGDNGDGHKLNAQSARWRTVERWNGDVVRRILHQQARLTGTFSAYQPVEKPVARASGPCVHRSDRVATTSWSGFSTGCYAQGALETPPPVAASGPPAAKTTVAPPGAPAVAASAQAHSVEPQHRRPARNGRGHRWHTTAMLGLAALVWASLALLLAGGHLSILLERGRAAPSIATELPFDVPPEADDCIDVGTVGSGMQPPQSTEPLLLLP